MNITRIDEAIKEAQELRKRLVDEGDQEKLKALDDLERDLRALRDLVEKNGEPKECVSSPRWLAS